MVREGDALLGSTITELRFRPGNTAENGRSGLNNHGQVAFVFELANGQSGVAIWSPDGLPCDPKPDADLNGDGVVGPADLAQLLDAWGDCAAPDYCAADLDGDGEVGPADLAMLLDNWG